MEPIGPWSLSFMVFLKIISVLGQVTQIQVSKSSTDLIKLLKLNTKNKVN